MKRTRKKDYLQDEPELLTVNEAIVQLQKIAKMRNEETSQGTLGETKLTVWTGPSLFTIKDVTVRAGGQNPVTVVVSDEPFFSVHNEQQQTKRVLEQAKKRGAPVQVLQSIRETAKS
jgi:hypothetical protein